MTELLIIFGIGLAYVLVRRLLLLGSAENCARVGSISGASPGSRLLRGVSGDRPRHREHCRTHERYTGDRSVRVVWTVIHRRPDGVEDYLREWTGSEKRYAVSEANGEAALHPAPGLIFLTREVAVGDGWRETDRITIPCSGPSGRVVAGPPVL